MLCDRKSRPESGRIIWARSDLWRIRRLCPQVLWSKRPALGVLMAKVAYMMSYWPKERFCWNSHHMLARWMCTCGNAVWSHRTSRAECGKSGILLDLGMVRSLGNRLYGCLTRMGVVSAHRLLARSFGCRSSRRRVKGGMVVSTPTSGHLGRESRAATIQIDPATHHGSSCAWSLSWIEMAAVVAQGGRCCG